MGQNGESTDCQKDDGFINFLDVKLPNTQTFSFNVCMNLKECASLCLRKCTCTAYANSDIRQWGSGWLLWFGDLIYIREFTQNGQEFYVSMPALQSGMNFSFSYLRNINLIQISWYIYSKVFNFSPSILASSFIPWFCGIKLYLYLNYCWCEKYETNYQAHYSME